MTTETAILNFQAAILETASARLDRSLTDNERAFVTKRWAFLALEAIQDMVSTGTAAALERYLNSEAPNAEAN